MPFVQLAAKINFSEMSFNFTVEGKKRKKKKQFIIPCKRLAVKGGKCLNNSAGVWSDRAKGKEVKQKGTSSTGPGYNRAKLVGSEGYSGTSAILVSCLVQQYTRAVSACDKILTVTKI